MEQRNKALIVGMAKSGIGAAKLLSQSGWDVIINDKIDDCAQELYQIIQQPK